MPDTAHMPHILVVDDDDGIRDLVTRYLNENGFFSLSVSSAEEALQALEIGEFDALVVDVMMPKITGLEFTQSLREKNNIPILLLTALGETQDRVSGLEMGADDYLVKPFEPRELVLRLKSILRRVPVKEGQDYPVIIGKWQFDPAYKEMTHENESLSVTLTEGEVALLCALLEKPGEVIARKELAEKCGMDGGERTVDVQITRLRRKIEEDSKAPRIIQTVRGKGYMLQRQVGQ